MEGNGRGEEKVKGKEGERWREEFGPPKNFGVAPPMRFTFILRQKPITNATVEINHGGVIDPRKLERSARLIRASRSEQRRRHHSLIKKRAFSI